MSIILSLAGNGISDDCLAWQGYREVASISGKDVVRIFGTRSRREMLASFRASQQIREARLADALAEGFLAPDLYRLTVAKLRRDALAAEVAVAPTSASNRIH